MQYLFYCNLLYYLSSNVKCMLIKHNPILHFVCALFQFVGIKNGL